ncbi:MAG TPA: hypothetical protein VEZ11_14255 [Thermoanaerobaculia bacterium]|nr:hypothetical protein [Thermoanaerobaculia bacterium]
MRHVKGILFLEYVRLLRANKGAPLAGHLLPDDFEFLNQRIDASRWYPMDVFERMGLAILAEIAGNDLELVRFWGRQSIDALALAQPDLFASADPRETFMRFQVLRQSLFDYPAVQIIAIHDRAARLQISYGMSPKAEEAAAYQSMGFLERLLEISKAREPEVRLGSRSWAGDETTVILVRWQEPSR